MKQFKILMELCSEIMIVFYFGRLLVQIYSRFHYTPMFTRSLKECNTRNVRIIIIIIIIIIKVKVKFTPEQTTKTQMGSRGIVLLLL
jgi:undecaprenyl pyrophosphate phosphatase UppP